jgi:RNA polymerase sigma-70 factor (ECF subfamily)
MDKLTKMQDKELVTLLKEGSQQAFEALYLRYIKKLSHFCIRLLRNEFKAEDIAHDVFLQVLETHHSINPEKSFSGYLYTIAKNLILYDSRKSDIHRRFVQHTIMNESDTTNQTEDQVIDNDYEQLLNEMIDGLSPQQKEVLRLSRIEGLTYKEIAELLHISLPTVKLHASLALKKIKKQLATHADLHFKAVITFLIFFL